MGIYIYIYIVGRQDQEKYGQTIRAEEWMEMESSNSNITLGKDRRRFFVVCSRRG